MIFFLPAQWRRITVTIVDCYFCHFFVILNSLMSASTYFITDFIGSTFMSYHIIAINHCFVRDHYWIDFVVSHYLALWLQRNGAISPSPWFIVVFWIFSLCYTHGWVQLLVGVADYNRSTFDQQSYYLYLLLFSTWPLLYQLHGVTFYSNFIPAQLRRISISAGNIFLALYIFLLTDEFGH